MKTKIIAPIFLLIFINLVFISCQEPTGIPDSGPVKPPKQIISVERAAEMYDSYSSRRVPIIKKYEDGLDPNSPPFTPTRYIEYDLETIKNYVAYVEYKAQQAEVDIKTLRFYLSNYTSDEKYPNGDIVRYPKRNSIFMLPTMEYEGENVGFSVEEVDGKYNAVPISKSVATRDQKQRKEQNVPKDQLNEASFFMSTTNAIQGVGASSLVLNDGQMMPPPGKDDFGVSN